MLDKGLEVIKNIKILIFEGTRTINEQKFVSSDNPGQNI